ncbi:MAG TPA: site-specific integrase [Paucimonas sp.]|nr:site-specific integrase [Paucimonas sp.]
METNRIRFNKVMLENLPLPPAGKRATYYDLVQPGLLVRVSSAGSKTFGIFRRTKNGPERVTIGPFPDLTVEQARKKASELLGDIAQGKSPAEAKREKRGELTLGEAFDRYITYHAIPQGLKTVEHMRGDFERYLGAIPDRPVKKHGKPRVKSPGSVNWQNKKLSAIDTKQIVRLKTGLAEKAGPAAANHAVKLLRVIFNTMIEWKEYKGENPATSVDLLKIKSRERFLQKEELPRLFKVLAETENTSIRDYILLSILTGARKSNVLAMRWKEIDFDRGEWRIPDTKNGEPVIVQLPAEAIDVLKGRQEIDDEWVFPGAGKSGHMQSPKRGVKAVLDRAGIEDLRIHDLRRTLGSWQAITGASLAVIGKSLGHKSVAATQIYARLSADPVRESVSRATAAMLEAAGVTKKAEVLKFTKKKA